MEFLVLALVLGAIVGSICWIEIPNRRTAAAARRAGGWPLAALKSDPDAYVIVQGVSAYPRSGWTGKKLGLLRNGETSDISAERVWSFHENNDLRWHSPSEGASAYTHFAQYVRDNPDAGVSVTGGLEHERWRGLRLGMALVFVLGLLLVMEYLVVGLKPW